ncbi:MAG: hypothetical protein ACI92E_002490 [Oceanicoccus sp.]|jgi:uncharacterized protein (TIGR02444 family)
MVEDQNFSEAGSMMDQNLLWNYSLSEYKKPDVEALLMILQDRFGADINLVLCCLWLATQGEELNQPELESLLKISASCQAKCIIPLRTLRRGLKGLGGAEAIREDVKSIELKAERWQQDLCYRQIEHLSSAVNTQPVVEIGLVNLRRYSENLIGVDWDDLSGFVIELINVTLVESNH